MFSTLGTPSEGSFGETHTADAKRKNTKCTRRACVKMREYRGYSLDPEASQPVSVAEYQPHRPLGLPLAIPNTAPRPIALHAPRAYLRCDSLSLSVRVRPLPTPIALRSPSNPSAANKWHTIHIPLSSFVLTNSGALSETQISVLKDKVRTVGFSILGSERVQESAALTGEERLEGAEATQEVHALGQGVERKFELGVGEV
ncbi:hypothetical protein QFC21_007137 [Naganishia friedmannii]|uniref:Uncharacterized protein n=1 Tax=Naganishia friedmannii TaxID=89922 RepID=A0ACC2UY11_9TREE|nr:hypothetical protein QFC21_007137 [Naganishia friedmannii]